jgi:hypothetical protein
VQKFARDGGKLRRNADRLAGVEGGHGEGGIALRLGVLRGLSAAATGASAGGLLRAASASGCRYTENRCCARSAATTAIIGCSGNRLDGAGGGEECGGRGVDMLRIELSGAWWARGLRSARRRRCQGARKLQLTAGVAQLVVQRALPHSGILKGTRELRVGVGPGGRHEPPK